MGGRTSELCSALLLLGCGVVSGSCLLLAAAEAFSSSAGVAILLVAFALLLIAASALAGLWSAREWVRADRPLPKEDNGTVRRMHLGEHLDDPRTEVNMVFKARVALREPLYWGLVARILFFCTVINLMAEMYVLKGHGFSGIFGHSFLCQRMPLLSTALHWQSTPDEDAMDCHDRHGNPKDVTGETLVQGWLAAFFTIAFTFGASWWWLCLPAFPWRP